MNFSVDSKICLFWLWENLLSPYNIICTRVWFGRFKMLCNWNTSLIVPRRSRLWSSYAWHCSKKCSVSSIPSLIRTLIVSIRGWFHLTSYVRQTWDSVFSLNNLSSVYSQKIFSKVDWILKASTHKRLQIMNSTYSLVRRFEHSQCYLLLTSVNIQYGSLLRISTHCAHRPQSEKMSWYNE